MSEGIMNPHHPEWDEFAGRLMHYLDSPAGCSHDHGLCFEILNAMRCDVSGSIAEFTRRGGYCDCEVVFNIVLPHAES